MKSKLVYLLQEAMGVDSAKKEALSDYDQFN